MWESFIGWWSFLRKVFRSANLNRRAAKVMRKTRVTHILSRIDNSVTPFWLDGHGVVAYHGGMTSDEFRAELRALGMSQRALAIRLGLAVTTVNRWALALAPVPQYAVAYLELRRELADISRRLLAAGHATAQAPRRWNHVRRHVPRYREDGAL